MKMGSRFILAATVSMLVAILAQAPQAQAAQYFTGGIGWFDFDNTRGASSTEFSGEWRGNAFYDNFLPVIGANINSDGGVYGYGGVDYDWQFTPNWYLTPGLAVGLYGHGGSIDLGGVLEFHETLEVDYKFGSDYRVGAQISHTSNANIYSNNPGENGLIATFSVPLGN